MERNDYVVVFDDLRDEKEETDKDEREDKREDKPPSYYLFNEILKNSTITIPVICSIRDGTKYDKCPDHVIMVIPFKDIERKEEVIPTYWESYVYWQYTRIKFSIHPLGFQKVASRMFGWFMQMKKMPYLIVTGFKDECPGLARIDIISCLVYNGLPDDRLIFIDNGRSEMDICIIKDLVKIVERNIGD